MGRFVSQSFYNFLAMPCPDVTTPYAQSWELQEWWKSQEVTEGGVQKRSWVAQLEVTCLCVSIKTHWKITEVRCVLQIKGTKRFGVFIHQVI